MRMLAVLIPLIITLYFIIDVVYPSFSEKPYWWFIKSFFGKTAESSFEVKIKEAEKTYKDAKKKMKDLKETATEETVGAKERLVKAEEVYTKAKETLEKLKK